MTCGTALIVAACSEPQPVLERFQVDRRDGRTVVTVRDASPATIDLSDAPVFVIGAGDEPTDLLYRVAGGTLMQDGSVVVANGGSNEIRFYTPSGGLRRTVGREGEGPGEFRGIYWMHAHTDNALAVVERGTSRLSVFDQTGELLDVVNVGFEPTEPSTPRSLISGTMMVAALSDQRIAAFPWIEAPLDGTPGPMAVAGPLRVFGPDLEPLADVGHETVATWYEGTESTDGPPIQMIWESPRLVSHGSLDRWAYSDARGYQIHVFEGTQPVVTIEEDRARVPFNPDSLRPGTASAADSLPAYRDLRVDRLGRVWAESPAGPDGTFTEWRAFSTDGVPIGILPVDPGTTVLDADESNVLLLLRDSLDVETVELRSVVWPEP